MPGSPRDTGFVHHASASWNPSVLVPARKGELRVKEDTLDASSSPGSDTRDFSSCFIGLHQSHDPARPKGLGHMELLEVPRRNGRISE